MIAPGQLLPIIMAPHHEKEGKRRSLLHFSFSTGVARLVIGACAPPTRIRAQRRAAPPRVERLLLRNLLQCVPDVGRERIDSLTSENRRKKTRNQTKSSQNDFCDTSSRQPFSQHGLHARADSGPDGPRHGPLWCTPEGGPDLIRRPLQTPRQWLHPFEQLLDESGSQHEKRCEYDDIK